MTPSSRAKLNIFRRGCNVTVNRVSRDLLHPMPNVTMQVGAAEVDEKDPP